MTMTSKELENEVMRLRKEVADYARVEDYIEIWKLMSIYTHLYHRLRNAEIPALVFAQKTPGVSMEVSDGGVYEGPEGVKRFFEMYLVNTKKPGAIALHEAVNPVIEINKDGTRAKGLFHSPGLGYRRFDEKLTAIWWYGKYNVEFVKEDGKWKFWRFHIYRLLSNNFDQPFSDYEADAKAGLSFPPELRPDGPAVDDYPYRRSELVNFKPDPPEPFETFDLKNIY